MLFTDQMGNRVELMIPPQRIVSLVPSQTELLFDLNLHEQVVGVTKFCVHPLHWRKEKTVVGGTKNFNLEDIERLNPDLIIGNKEENYEEGINSLSRKYPVWMSDIKTFEDALQMIQSVSQLVHKETEGAEILKKIQSTFAGLKPFVPMKTLYLMWRNPWMGAAGNTFIHSMMEKFGFINVLHDHSRYPELSPEAMKELNPSLILLSSEPYPFTENHFSEVRKIFPQSRIILVDGEIFSWYGSRLILAPDYINSLQL